MNTKHGNYEEVRAGLIEHGYSGAANLTDQAIGSISSRIVGNLVKTGYIFLENDQGEIVMVKPHDQNPKKIKLIEALKKMHIFQQIELTENEMINYWLTMFCDAIKENKIKIVCETHNGKQQLVVTESQTGQYIEKENKKS